MNIREMIKGNEGLRLKPYRCSSGRLTIGYGRNLEDGGISVDEAEHMLDNDIRVAAEDVCGMFPGFARLPGSARFVLIDMRFNLGPGGFRKFKRMIAAVRDGDFERAAMEIEDSLYYEQVGVRSMKNAEMMRAAEKAKRENEEIFE
jgi:lysozyme